MLGIVSMAGNALKAFGNTHPAVKWGVIVLAFLLAAEFVGKEGISLYRDMATVKLQTDATNQENTTKTVQECLKRGLRGDCTHKENPGSTVSSATGLTAEGCKAGEHKVFEVCRPVNP